MVENISKSLTFQDLIDSLKILPPVQLNLIKVLYKKGPSTRKDLSDELSIPRSTVYDNLRKLEKQELVEKFPFFLEGKQGRPPVFWQIK